LLIAAALAEPEGFMQVFVDEGPEMTVLLYKALSRDFVARYIQCLLAA
jgi:LuxR family maltose regulon positive regulatory protein